MSELSKGSVRMGADEHDVTIGELNRTIGGMQATLRDGLGRLEDRMERWEDKFVSRELYESEKKTIHDRLDSSATNRHLTYAAVVTGATALATVGAWIHQLSGH